jgi:protein tyrosine/serine phosphatase
VVENDVSEDHLSFEQLVGGSDLSAAWFRDHCLGFYTRAPYEPRHVDLYRRYFRALAENDGAILVHCAAGKDRTGLICALTHHVAGVHRDDMVQDYLLTNDEARIAAKIASIGPYLERLTGKRPAEAALRVAVGVHADYLDRAFAEIETRDGSLDGYLENTLGLDAALRERVRDRLLS